MTVRHSHGPKLHLLASMGGDVPEPVSEILRTPRPMIMTLGAGQAELKHQYCRPRCCKGCFHLCSRNGECSGLAGSTGKSGT